MVLCFPFGLSVIEPGTNGQVLHSGLVEQIFKTAGGYPYASVNAYNPWALATAGGNGIAANGAWACDTFIPNPPAGDIQCTDAVTIAGIPAVYVGAALLVIAFVVVGLAVARRPTPLTLLIGLTVLAVAFFVLPTRVHERYLFPFIALGAILAGFSLRWRIAYIALSLTTFLNMYVVLTTLYPDSPGIRDWLGIGETIRSTNGVTAIALTTLVAALWIFTELRPSAIRRLAEEIEDDADLDEDRLRELEPEPSRPVGAIPAGSAGLADASVPMAMAPRGPVPSPAGGGSAAALLTADAMAIDAVPVPSWSAPPSLVELGPIGWFRARLADRPVRADRSRELDRESGGRLDRLDLWILVVLVVSILGIRMFRLGEPYQMHFDEVYHARTAAEFLEDWRYGISHSIYEWTHPHLAKYAMAGGLVAWGNNRVTATAELGVPVLDAAIEPQVEDPVLAAQRSGNRVDVATGSEVRSYDLVTRALVATIPIDGAQALAVDDTASLLYVGAADGSISTIDLTALDAAHSGASGAAVPQPEAFGQVDGAIQRLFVAPDGGGLLVETSDDRLITLDPDTAGIRGTVQLDTAGDMAPGGSAPVLSGGPDAVPDAKAASKAIVAILGGDAATYEGRLRSGAETTVIARINDSDQRAKVQKAIDDGQLAGLSIDSAALVAVADAKGVELIDPATGELVKTVDVGGPAHGLAQATADTPTLYVATDPDPASDVLGRMALVATGGDGAKNGPVFLRSMPMPGPVSRVLYDDSTEMIHVLGRTPDGADSTIYVIQTRADDPSVFADARLPFDPSAWVMDSNRDAPTDDRQQILTFSPTGSVASVDVGHNEFAWRLPGVLAGAAMAGFLYLLARILFRRRSVGVLVAIISVVDGMFFVQSRIGMNDAYVGLAIVAAYTVFAALWMGSWRFRGAFWLAMPAIGAILGLGLASKWVALYALGGIALLIMARSALGRLMTILSMIGLTAVLGYLAINVPVGTGFGNLPFVALMVGLTVIAVVATVAHPIAWSLDETRFAVGAPMVLGGIAILALVATGRATPATGAAATGLSAFVTTPMAAAVGLFLLGPVAWVAFAIAGRFGFGPLAPAPAPDEPAALLPPPSPPPSAAWLRPGAQYGLPVVWMVLSLLVLPVAIYIASYLPWAFVENHQLFPGWPPGHTGQTLLDLTGAMYAYHNGLTAPHAASSPWWAWLFDLKPVWFYQEGLAGNTTSAIYDAGNLVVWWLGLPALAFAAWQAFSRRSLALALITIGFACQWVSWSRIDRASFQYHYYTSLPFLFLALAYFLAELWHGASRRTWLLARLTAAVGVLGPALMWTFDRPICAFVGVTKANPGSQACPPIIPQFLLTSQTLAMAIVVGVAVLVFLRLLGRMSGRDPLDSPDGNPDGAALVPLLLTAAGAFLLTIAVRMFIPDTPLITIDKIPVEPVAILLGALIAVPIAAVIATARDARRFVVGAVVAMIAWFVVEYPNISALPLPTAIANVYQGVLPSYLYAFQFPVNNVAASVQIHLLGAVPLMLGAAMVFLCLVVAYSTWVWRLALAERSAAERDRFELGGAGGATGGAGGGSRSP